MWKLYVITAMLLGIYDSVNAQPTHVELIQELRPADTAADLQFGESVEAGDGIIVGGAWKATVNGIANAGAVYVFEGDIDDGGFTETAKLVADDPVDNAHFGRAVATHNRVVVGGALNGENGDIHPGAAYVFEEDFGMDHPEWMQTAKLVAPDGEDGALFGSDVHIFDDIIVAGAYLQGGHGSAYIFLRDDNGSWNHHQTLNPPDNAFTTGAEFGRAVSVFDTTIVIGAYKESKDDISDVDDGVATANGAVYVYEQYSGSGMWELFQKLEPSTTEDDHRFGLFLGEYEGEMAIGSVRATGGDEENTGVVYIFHRGYDKMWTETEVLTSSDGDNGDRFGRTSSIYKNIMVVGAHRHPGDGDLLNPETPYVGNAFLFEREQDGSWIEVAVIDNPYPQDLSWFGREVSVSDRVIAIGAPQDSNGAGEETHAGVIYVYKYIRCQLDGPYSDSYLAGIACGGGFSTLEEAQDECCSCESCHGVVQTPSGIYKTRASDFLRPSFTRTRSWIMDEPEHACSYDAGASGQALLRYACDETKPFYNVAAAKRACCECNECGGVTCLANGECTIREATSLTNGWADETSYLRSADPGSCDHLQANLVPTLTGSGHDNAWGLMDVWIADDQETLTVQVEYHNTSTPIKGIHIHEPVFHLKVLLICTEAEFNSGFCVGTYGRNTPQKLGLHPWDELVSGLKSENGHYALLHSESNENGELSGPLFCDGVPKAISYSPCNPFVCIPEYKQCAADHLCLAVSTLYSYNRCTFGDSFETTTPADECWSMLSFSHNLQPSLQYLRNLVACILCCGDEQCKLDNTVTG